MRPELQKTGFTDANRNLPETRTTTTIALNGPMESFKISNPTLPAAR